MLKLLVIEDHSLVREGLVRLLGQLSEESNIQEAADFESALSILDKDDDFDLIFLDLALPGIDGFSGLDVLRRGHAAIPVVVVSAYDDQPTITRAMNLGASGFIPKAYSGDQFLAAVKAILQGELFRPQAGGSARIDHEPPMAQFQGRVTASEIGLTARQAQVLCLMVRGLSNRDIGQQLGLSEGTVKIHVTAIFKALGVTSRTQALLSVSRYGIDFEDVF